MQYVADTRYGDPEDQYKTIAKEPIPEHDVERLLDRDTTSAGSSTFYPYDIPPGLGYCGESTFVDQTSDASPNSTHCRIIIENIQGDAKTDFTHTVANKPHREILKHEDCHFGIEAASVSGNANFKVEGQDVIDIVNNALEKFESDGRIGAKGFMNCNGNIKSQPVEWGIY